jgi:succinyl-CoA:(S)-malate CoA-transferase subunit B
VILKPMKTTNEERPVTTGAAEKRKRPLDGIRVLELANYLAGPFCCTQLAEFGAEVVKVEMPTVGDPGRRYGTATLGSDDATLMFLSESRNKKSVTVDLRTPEGSAIIRRLVRDFDVLVENFQVGTMEGWGLGWEDLKKENPRLVMVRITGFGQTGPLRDRPGFGRIGIAFGGLGYICGYPDRPPTAPGTATLADYLAGTFAANGALLALRARDLYGEGQYVDLGLYESVFRILDETAPVYKATGKVRQRTGPASHNSVPHSHFPTKDGRWVGIACTNDKIFARLADAMGRPELASHDKWGTYKARRAEDKVVDATVSAWTASLHRDELLEICDARQVPCGPVYAIDEIFDDPHFAARENILMVPDDRVGEVAVPNVVPRLSATPGYVERLGPTLGAHNKEVFCGMLGMSAAEVEDLSKRKVI